MGLLRGDFKLQAAPPGGEGTIEIAPGWVEAASSQYGFFGDLGLHAINSNTMRRSYKLRHACNP